MIGSLLKKGASPEYPAKCSQVTLLPGRPKPLEGEHFLSWLTRLARANLCEPTQFTQIILSGQDVWGGCVNGGSSLHPERTLSSLTGLQPELISGLYSLNFAREHFVELNQIFASHYFLPANCAGRMFTNNWMQYCPRCLANDRTPYFRNIWRISFLPICLQHSCLLHDCCPNCGKSINFHQVPYQTNDCAVCFNCQFPLSQSKLTYCRMDENLLYISRQLHSGIESGWVNLRVDLQVMMPLFIAGIWVLLKPFFRKKTASQIRHYFNLPLEANNKHIDKFGHFPPLNRSQFMSSIGHLLPDWPHRFLMFCNDLTLNRIAFYVNEQYIPFWVDKMLKYTIKKQPYWVNDNEFMSAALYLKRLGYEVSYANIAEAVGLNRSCQHSDNRTKIIQSVAFGNSSSRKFHWK